ncbi:type VI secretion system baseplate subunit TssF [Paraburkholderia phymatum]|uniref:Type VI secretion protein, VC_A0110 family n=1 Tax=Paraburkholderia phymatum (strain DSM 17167 / CIP 108236 / LMG 21445 / STM815) TaxID=391038 RepID=B2JTX6_PARP8|nr:type VI secretion system baseplate subunit TssF [Paraburkholderia phymatum]ACC76029.1 type VI secretion protein, VC_A0110 family [Paraburkholderia phymatum STM815]
MDPRTLEFYTRELRFQRAMASEFAADHLKIARRLGMEAGDIGDPYVERLVQGSAFVNARIQMRFDDEFPQLTQALLSCVYPNYLLPTPSIAVARFYPGGKAGDLVSGHRITRGTLATSKLPEGEKTPCQFSLCHDVTLYPLEISFAKLGGIPPDIYGMDRFVPPHRRVHGGLRLRIRTTGDVPVASLQGLDRLPVCLAGDAKLASHLHELIHTAAIATVAGEPGRFSEAGYAYHTVTSNAVIQEGIGPEESVLPLASRKFLGHNLVHEYFACPERFYFFTLTGLAAGLRNISGHEAEIVVLLDRPAGDLADRVDASMFALFCAPVINLFPLRTESMPIREGAPETHIVPVEKRPLDFELHSLERVLGQVTEESEVLEFRPLHQALMRDEDSHGRYFTVRREQHLAPGQSRRYGTHSTYVSTESFLQLVGPDGEPYDNGDDGEIHFVSVQAWVTNRDLPSLLRCNGVRDLDLRQSAPVSSIGLIRPPGRPKAPFAQGIKAWQLLMHLDIDHSVFDDRYDEPHPGEGLQSFLRLYLSDDAVAHRRQVESLTAATLTPVNRIIPNQQPPVARVLECGITVDESGFDGASPYVFGLVLEHYLARHVSMHSYTAIVLDSKQRGRIAQWPPRPGTRSVV